MTLRAASFGGMRPGTSAWVGTLWSAGTAPRLPGFARDVSTVRMGAGRGRTVPAAALRLRNARTGSFTGSSFPQPRHSSTSTSPTLPLPDQIRSLMRLLPHSVVVCTAMHNNTPRAMTMSSFTSLTLQPTPLVSFNVASPSRTLDAIAGARAFNIHVMAGDARGARLADRFTKGNAGAALFDGLEWVMTTCEGEGGAPVLREEGVLRVLRCKVLDEADGSGLVRVRDHVIVVGEVVEVLDGRDEGGGFGLAYADRRYRQVGAEILKHKE
ncbi:hypothetical protein S40288_04410 [Stachybotrys chartarum IBT 40288]|nr:hypothetical protein S40288_04410 [Stachybotrys chartarum IBT 40288]